MERISVAMATYCGARFLTQQLDSLRNQTRPADEVIILDDRSSDNTAELVQNYISEYGLKNWKFAVNAENLGFIRNFQKALSETTGDIIFLCDQDDVWHPDKLEIMCRLLQEHPEALSVNGSFSFIDGEGRPISVPETPGTSNHGLLYRTLMPEVVTEVSLLELAKSNVSPGCTMAVRRQLKECYLAQTDSTLPHDLELNLLAARDGKALFYNAPVIDYRVHGGNAIGLRVSEDSKKLEGNENTRVKLLHEQIKLRNYLQDKLNATDPALLEYISVFSRYVTLREKCLVRHNVFAWPSLYSCYPKLLPQIPKKWYYGDLIYTLRLQKLFERS